MLGLKQMDMNLQTIEIIIVAVIAFTAVGSLVVAIISLKSSSTVKKKQVSLREKQEELLDLQLKHRKEIMKRDLSDHLPEKAADIRVSLEGSSQKARFVIRNWGDAPAANVNLYIEPVDGRTSPLIEGDVKTKLPIPRLAPGTDCALIAAISFDSGTTFDVSWSWREVDGTEKQKNSRLSL
jgi:hypothetical protein